jgi:hypothetical protein
LRVGSWKYFLKKICFCVTGVWQKKLTHINLDEPDRVILKFKSLKLMIFRNQIQNIMN